MVTAPQFRQMALSLAQTVEGWHMHHPDFRVGGRIFATLGYPDDAHGVLILTPDDQQQAIGRLPEAFSAASGAWGRQGSTVVLLRALNAKSLWPWMESAWKNVASKRPRSPVAKRQRG